ncbi:MAG: hypothetical protein KZQ89_19495 [Candidatus Thiodiazotropha sp. (ex Lucinoma kastoroae)]|nr:hypothetical protein [Candidatus Thiodiazotropha sp. (ex Lucinoma kastoroae)]
MKANIHAYLVVRRPEFNYDELGRGAYLPYPPNIDGLHYGGIDRMGWFDLDEDYYNGSLPNEFIELRKMALTPSKTIGVDVSANMYDAVKLLAYSNTSNDRNELIALFSYSDQESAFEAEFDGELTGCDLYCNGYGSLIREGIFTKPEVFKESNCILNKFGLLDFDNELINNYIKEFERLAIKENLEIMLGPIRFFLIYRVFTNKSK